MFIISCLMSVGFMVVYLILVNFVGATFCCS